MRSSHPRWHREGREAHQGMADSTGAGSRTREKIGADGFDADVADAALRLAIVEPARGPESPVPPLDEDGARRQIVLARQLQQSRPRRQPRATGSETADA